MLSYTLSYPFLTLPSEIFSATQNNTKYLQRCSYTRHRNTHTRRGACLINNMPRARAMRACVFHLKVGELCRGRCRGEGRNYKLCCRKWSRRRRRHVCESRAREAKVRTEDDKRESAKVSSGFEGAWYNLRKHSRLFMVCIDYSLVKRVH
jgi:hypothetical protein